MRVISGLSWAEACPRPACIPKSRPRGAKAAGLRYERELAKALPLATHGQWWQFEDRAGPGYCQTDLVLPTEGGLLVLEAKYTWTQTGHRQIQQLYKPVLERATGKLVVGAVVCKVLIRDLDPAWVCRDLESAKMRAFCGLPTVLHWLGTGLGPFRDRSPPSHLASGLVL